MDIINLTPHEITIYNDNEVVKVYPPSGTIVRARSESTPAGELDGVPVVEFVFTADLDNLPEPAADTIYIVSTLAIQALPHPRYDVVAPDTGPESAIRDAAGKIVGIRRFQRPEWS
jgi:hypothetical protein